MGSSGGGLLNSIVNFDAARQISAVGTTEQ
jgi:hypothetical protein